MKIENYKLKIIKHTFVSFFLLVAANSVFAADISIDTEKHVFDQGEEFQVPVFLNSEGEHVNAVEGSLVFPSNLLEVKEIRDGDSSVNFWIERPRIETRNISNDGTNSNKKISDVSCLNSCDSVFFSGIIPGGFSRPKEFLFSVIFRAKLDGSGAIQPDGLKLLSNDGAGTQIKTTASSFSFSISKNSNLLSSEIGPVDDTSPPEDFEPSIVSDTSISDGKYFVVFATQDKKSGIDRYELQESGYKRPDTKQWTVAESPYVFKDQNLRSYIYIRAIDKKGNERLVVLSPTNRAPWYEDYGILVIIITIIIAGLYFRNKWHEA